MCGGGNSKKLGAGPNLCKCLYVFMSSPAVIAERASFDLLQACISFSCENNSRKLVWAGPIFFSSCKTNKKSLQLRRLPCADRYIWLIYVHMPRGSHGKRVIQQLLIQPETDRHLQPVPGIYLAQSPAPETQGGVHSIENPNLNKLHFPHPSPGPETEICLGTQQFWGKLSCSVVSCPSEKNSL